MDATLGQILENLFNAQMLINKYLEENKSLKLEIERLKNTVKDIKE